MVTQGNIKANYKEDFITKSMEISFRALSAHLLLDLLLPRSISKPLLQESILKFLPEQQQILLKLDLVPYPPETQVVVDIMLIEL